MKSINDITKIEAHKFIENLVEDQGYTFVNAFALVSSQEFLGHKECSFNFINHSGRCEGATMTLWLDPEYNLKGEW